MFRKSLAFLYMVYDKFQAVILSVFVLGLLDLMAYSDLIAAMIAIPEFAPLLIGAVLILGIVITYKFLWRNVKEVQPMKGLDLFRAI